MKQKLIPIYLVLQGGLVQNAVNIPPNIEIVVLDHDVEGADAEDVSTSPLDGQPCCIQYFS